MASIIFSAREIEEDGKTSQRVEPFEGNFRCKKICLFTFSEFGFELGAGKSSNQKQVSFIIPPQWETASRIDQLFFFHAN